ncbi:Proteasome subunit beta type-6 [Hordeum vulgare]|nr:Proteasome subunit beta type-6 [Hordeum vulgare]
MDASSSLMGGPASPDAPTDGQHRMGTTIVGVCYDGGVVLAADSRTSTGMYVENRASDKITQLTDNVYVCRSGAVSQQVLRPIHSRKMVKIEHCDEGDATSAGASAPRSGTIDPQQLDRTLVVVKAEEELDSFSKKRSYLLSKMSFSKKEVDLAFSELG